MHLYVNEGEFPNFAIDTRDGLFLYAALRLFRYGYRFGLFRGRFYTERVPLSPAVWWL